MPGGFEAVQLRVAEQYVHEFGRLAKEGNTLRRAVEPRRDIASMIALAMNAVRRKDGEPPAIAGR